MKILLALAGSFLVWFGGVGALAEQIPPQVAKEKVENGALLLDVRSAEEYSELTPGTVNIPHTELPARASELGSDKTREIVVYCRSGRRSQIAIDRLREEGFTKLYNAGGYKDLAPLFKGS